MFRTIGVSPTSNLSRPFESAVAQHDELQAAVESTLADVFHAKRRSTPNIGNIATYTTVLTLGRSLNLDDPIQPLRDSLEDEQGARDDLTRAIARLSQHATQS